MDSTFSRLNVVGIGDCRRSLQSFRPTDVPTVGVYLKQSVLSRAAKVPGRSYYSEATSTSTKVALGSTPVNVTIDESLGPTASFRVPVSPVLSRR